ncbi:hypothetical protein MLD38_017280 [Melastoma candidum]|uniref:Uncharacterized protein n=1 Tax=Melastoma candidum TaxID=119954 RepID=A0ACB9QU70_9MYRT|nr:hypothetical protein MLD38_017280 [Melastoma candidum]
MKNSAECMFGCFVFQISWSSTCFSWSRSGHRVGVVLHLKLLVNNEVYLAWTNRGFRHRTIGTLAVGLFLDSPISLDSTSKNRWMCICTDNGFPKIASGDQNSDCFEACDCSSGFPNEKKLSVWHNPTRIVVAVLLGCAILIAIAFVVSLACYLWRKDKCRIQSSASSLDRETGCNSNAKLVYPHSSSSPETKLIISSPIKAFAGFFYKVGFISKPRSGTLRGTIWKFSCYELEYATQKFSNSNIIGVGGSSYVYRGQLRDGRIVAIKRLNHQDKRDDDSEFLTEVDLLSRLHHYHMVPLLGYCYESRGKHIERLLIFEYMANGNLRDCLDSDLGENMNWETRVGIALGAARGLEYLHEAAAPRVLHRDVKSTNILLDDNWRAKITDLGMAKCVKADGHPSCSNSPARMQGTFGYFAPEYAIVGRVSLKSDVFSFGVVLLELITGRQPIHKLTGKGEESLVIWATPRLQDSRRVISELPDPRLDGNFPEEEMQIMAYLAKECLLLDPDSRPTMSEVVQILSAIAPDNSRMRSIRADLLEWSSTSSFITETITERPSSSANSPTRVNVREHSKVAFIEVPDPCPLPGKETKNHATAAWNGEDISHEQRDRLISLSSEARSWQANVDESVDLTEPRFESFCVTHRETGII